MGRPRARIGRASRAAALGALALCSACDSAALTGDGGAPGDAGAPSGSRTCPAAAPADGAACGGAYLECEFGSSPVLECDTVAICEGAHWAVTPARTSPADCPPALSLDCPATFVTASTASTGSAPCRPFGVSCDYPQGRCECGVGMGPVPSDAAASARWSCQEPAAGCPRPRPRLGAACEEGGQTCDYGSCSVPGGSTVKCANGAWRNEPFACAL